MATICAHCGASGQWIQCAGIHSAHFCSRQCQKAAWGVHKTECKDLAQQRWWQKNLKYEWWQKNLKYKNLKYAYVVAEEFEV
jgi:hypothetical protein